MTQEQRQWLVADIGRRIEQRAFWRDEEDCHPDTREDWADQIAALEANRDMLTALELR